MYERDGQTYVQTPHDGIGRHYAHHRVAKQALSYRKQIARQLRTQYIAAIYSDPVTFKSKLRVTEDHWKRNHWMYHTRLTISRVIGR